MNIKYIPLNKNNKPQGERGGPLPPNRDRVKIDNVTFKKVMT